MNVPRNIRGLSTSRSLDQMKNDFDRFSEHENKNHAKFCNNVIAEPFFNIPLDQV